MERRQLKGWALGFGFYAVVAALFAVQKFLLYASHGKPFGLHDAVITCLGIYTWAALTPVIFFVARRHPLDGPSLNRSILAHVLTLLVVVPIDMGVYVLLDEAFRGLTWGEDPPSLGARFLKLLAWGGPGDILWYAGVVAVSHATSSHEKLRQGEIRLERGYDQVRATVAVAGSRILDAALRDPRPLRNEDAYYVASMHLAHTPRGLRLVQVDPELELERAERGRPLLAGFEAAAWGCQGARPSYPVSASFTLARVTLPALRYLCRPDVLAFEGSERV